MLHEKMCNPPMTVLKLSEKLATTLRVNIYVKLSSWTTTHHDYGRLTCKVSKTLKVSSIGEDE